MTQTKKPIVYSCSGCSNLALIAHDLALNLDRDGIADMSCISGVAGNVPEVVEFARSGRPIIAIDGCDQQCTKACANNCDVTIDHYFELSQFGIAKHGKWEGSLSENSIALNAVYQQLMDLGYIENELL